MPKPKGRDLPDKVPFGTTTDDHPFAFRHHLYRHIEDTERDGAIRPATIPRADLEASWARQDAAREANERKRAEREAAKVAAITAVQDRKEADKAAKARHDEAMAYVAGYAGTWPLVLDIRADRRWGTKYMKLSERQVEVLLAGKARDAARVEAAQIDRELFAADQWEAHVARSTAPQAAGLAPQPTRPAGLGQVTEDGMYRTPDGTIWKVQRAVHGSGQLYAKRLTVEPGQTGTFTYEPGAIRRLRPENRMTLEDAKAFGKLYGVCCQCGRTLTDEVSIADGIGPVCAGRL
jgi:hypothetical protein